VYLNVVGGWTEFRTFNLPYFWKSCTFSMYGKMSVVLAIVRQMLKLMEVIK
jgi:hypothetical protein